MGSYQVLQFPHPESADQDGLIGVGGELTTPNLIEAYSMGIFPWSVDPVSWWSPDPRAIFEIGDLHVGRSLRRFLRQTDFRVTMDSAFESVVRECSVNRKEGTWIDEKIIKAYSRFHEDGYGHSIEVWAPDGALVGGLYGVAIHGLFAGESMFSRETNASKLALVALMQVLKEHQFCLFDIQMLTPVTESLGAIEITRKDYLDRLAHAMNHISSSRDNAFAPKKEILTRIPGSE